MKTYILPLIRTIAVVALLIVSGFSWVYYGKNCTYKEAVALVEKGAYEDSLGKFEEVNDKINFGRKNFIWYDKFKRNGKYFKNSKTLYIYALVQENYNSENMNMEFINNGLEGIPSDYSGELSGEIKTFRENFKSQYDVYKAEKEYRNKKFAEFGDTIPRVGMSEDDIKYTIVRDANESETDNSDGHTRTKYYWYSKTSSYDLILTVECVDHVVVDVEKYNIGLYWQAGTPDFYARPKVQQNTVPKTGPKTTPKKSDKKKKSDPYDVYDYDDPDDFYEDNYDDFDDYEDAEDYFDEHHKR